MPIAGLEGNVRTLPPQLHERTREHTNPRGAEVLDDGSVRFRFWAPASKVVHLETDGMNQVLALRPKDRGGHELGTKKGCAGSRYQFILADGTRVPDPASRFQPVDVHGYDGALLCAPDSSYDRPEDLRTLVQEAHARGLMVFLDVVYNHFGPDGNDRPVCVPKRLTDKHKTGWGDAVNFAGEEGKNVREFTIHNAICWIEEFHLDGRRLDSVHAIMDAGPKHLLDGLAERVREAAVDRHVHLILENEQNQASGPCRNKDGEPQHYTAQWNDDMYHPNDSLDAFRVLDENLLSHEGPEPTGSILRPWSVHWSMATEECYDLP